MVVGPTPSGLFIEYMNVYVNILCTYLAHCGGASEIL